MDGTNLVSVSVQHVRDSLKVFGEKGSDNSLAIVARPTKGRFPFVSVPAGVYALKYRHGVLERKPLEPGFHWLSAFEEVRYVITKQNTHCDVSAKSTPCKDNVLVTIDVFLTFHIHDPIQFIETLSAEKLSDLLKAGQAEAIRNLANQTPHNHIYDLVALDESNILEDLRKKFLGYGVTITELMITDVALPNDIAWRLEQETTFISRHRLQKRKQEFDMLLTKHVEYLEQKRLQYKNERLAFTEQAKRERALISKEIDEIEGRTEKLLAETAAEQDRIVRQIEEEANKFCANLDEERHALIKRMRAESNKRRAALLTEAEAFNSELRAQTEAQVAALKAQVTKITSTTESEIASKLEERRRYDQKQRSLDVSAELGREGGNLVVSGGTNGNIIAQIAASSYQRALYMKALADDVAVPFSAGTLGAMSSQQGKFNSDEPLTSAGANSYSDISMRGKVPKMEPRM